MKLYDRVRMLSFVIIIASYSLYFLTGIIVYIVPVMSIVLLVSTKVFLCLLLTRLQKNKEFTIWYKYTEPNKIWTLIYGLIITGLIVFIWVEPSVLYKWFLLMPLIFMLTDEQTQILNWDLAKSKDRLYINKLIFITEIDLHKISSCESTNIDEITFHFENGDIKKIRNLNDPVERSIEIQELLNRNKNP